MQLYYYYNPAGNKTPTAKPGFKNKNTGNKMYLFLLLVFVGLIVYYFLKYTLKASPLKVNVREVLLNDDDVDEVQYIQ